MRLPQFLSVGVQKSGTKWLHFNLSKHPDIFLPHAGGGLEVHYFDSHHLGDVEWYGTHYSPATSESVLGDITPQYFPMPPARVRAVRELLPDAKVVVTLRNPKDRAISAVRMEMVGKTFGGAPRKVVLTPDSPLEDIIAFCTTGDGFRHGDYLTHLETWRSVFPPEQLLVLSYDSLVVQPAPYLKEIQTFLGVEHFIHPSRLTERVHVTERIPVPDELKTILDLTFDPITRALQGKVPFDVGKWLAPTRI